MGDTQKTNLKSSGTVQTYDVVAEVASCKGGFVTVLQRNKFSVGDELEILSPDSNFQKTFVVTKILDQNGNEIESAKVAQQKITIACPFKLHAKDMLRKQK